MGSVSCGCYDSNVNKLSEIPIISPKNRISFFSFGPFSSQIIQNPEEEQEYRVKLLKLHKSSKSIKLKVINEGPLSKGTAFIIRPNGLENSLRDVKDGYTYIGNFLRKNGEVINDIHIPDNSAEAHRNFMIAYSIEKNIFFIKELYAGMGPYIKISHQTVSFKQVLKNNSLVSIGENYLTFGIEESRGNSLLMIKKFSENENGNIHTFNASDCIKDLILIGRKSTCHVCIEDSLISKVQCNVFYDIGVGWVLSDGNGDKESVNGTWIYARDEVEITSGLIFKANMVLFQILLI